MAGRRYAVAADLADETAVLGLLAQTERELGPVGCLVNNAGVFENDTVETVSRESWDQHMAVNLRAPFVLMQQMAARLPADAGGVIVNLLDERVWSLTPYFVSYTLSKAGLWTLTQTMALALSAAHPRQWHWAGADLAQSPPDRGTVQHQCSLMPLRRGTSPQEVAAALRFILSAPALTGQMIALDGGQHLGWAQPQRTLVNRIGLA